MAKKSGIKTTTTKDRKVSRKEDLNDIQIAPFLNRYSTYPSKGLTPTRLTAIFKEADDGDIFRQAELFEEMLEKDNHLFGVFQRRKLAVAKLDFEIVPFSSDGRDVEIAEDTRKMIEGIKGFRQAKEDILDAVPKAVSFLQIMWKMEEGKALIDRLEYTHAKNFRFGRSSDPKSDLNEIRRLTDENRADGLELERFKWIVSTIKARSGHPARTSLLRTNSWMYLFKNFDVKAWVQFAEIFGMPIRLGKYNATTGEDEKNKLYQALIRLGQDAAALIPDTTSIEFVENAQKAATAAIHRELGEFCNGEISKSVLAHTGSADSTPGKLGGEDNASEATLDLFESDALAMDYIISDQLIPAYVQLNHGPQKGYPYFKTKFKRPKDRKELIEVYDGAINRIGIPVVKSDVYADLDIRMPKEGEEVILPNPNQSNPLPFKNLLAGADKKKVR